jgi:hypothetical protein
MNEESNIDPPPVPDGPDTEVVPLLKRIQQQLLFLEKKIDLLISQPQERPSEGKASPGRLFQKRPFSKPFRSFDHPQRHGKGEHGYGPREKDSVHGHIYDHRPREKSRGPSPKKKPFSFKRKDRE